MRLIDADKLIEELENLEETEFRTNCIKLLRCTPTVEQKDIAKTLNEMKSSVYRRMKTMVMDVSDAIGDQNIDKNVAVGIGYALGEASADVYEIIDKQVQKL